jgi:CheY-like chemotaxis protein
VFSTTGFFSAAQGGETSAAMEKAKGETKALVEEGKGQTKGAVESIGINLPRSVRTLHLPRHMDEEVWWEKHDYRCAFAAFEILQATLGQSLFRPNLLRADRDRCLMPSGFPSPTILFVDSFEDARKYYVQRLSMSSPEYVILEADTAAEGLSLCKSLRIDCVVAELDLPDMSGFHLLLDLVPRVLHPEIAVIILTHIDVATLPEHALKNGALAYLVKTRTSGDDLDKVILKALAVVPPSHKELQT